MFRIHRLFISALAFVLTTGAVLAQQPEDPPARERRRPRQREEGDRGNREMRGERGDREGRGGRRGQRDFGRRMMEATPEEARQMRIDGMVQMLTRTYELTEEQQAKVKAEVTKISDEYRASMGKDAEEMDKIGKEMREYWKQRRAAGGNADGDEGRDRPRSNPMEDPKFQELMGQMRVLREKHPMDWEGSIERVEALLPPEQAAKGRERREERMNQWRDRANRGNDPELGPTQRRGRGGRGRDGEPGGRGERRRAPDGETKQPRGPLAGPSVSATPGPQHPWDVFAEKFINNHQLSESQADGARSIVLDMKQKAAAVRESLAVNKDMGGEARAKKRQELEARLEKMFEEMKSRMEALLTAEQRAGVKKA